MSGLSTPIISVVIGEGGSGGALAIGVADKLLMLEYSIYSVISPEGCASILWKNSNLAEKAAGSMHITSKKLEKIGLIDEIITEPLGGAHRDIKKMSNDLRDSLIQGLNELMKTNRDQLLAERNKKISGYGEFSQ